jgi:hypothetical protein
MNKPTVIDIDCLTQQKIVREMTDEEYAQLQKDQTTIAVFLAKQQEELN